MRENNGIPFVSLIPFLSLVTLLCIGKPASAQQPGGPSLPAATPVALPPAYTAPAINYIRTWEPSIPLTEPAAVMANSQVAEMKQTTQYFDGLGRQLQTVAKGMSDSGKDIVSPVVYDAFGRE